MFAISSVVCPSPLLNNNMFLLLVPPRLIINLSEMAIEMKKPAFVPAHLTRTLNVCIRIFIWFFGCSLECGVAHATINRKP